MNVKKIFKKVLMHIGFILVLIIATSVTTIIVSGKSGDSGASDAIRTELGYQKEQNRKLRSENANLQRERKELQRTIITFEGIEQRLNNTNRELEEYRKVYERNNTESELDIKELGRVEREDREAIDRIRKILQGQDN